jgi:hypothetical protein
LDDALTDCVSVRQADGGTEKDDAGEKAETDASSQRRRRSERISCPSAAVEQLLPQMDERLPGIESVD